MVHNIADVTPGGSAVALAASRTPCNWVQFIAPSGNAGAVRVGDSTTSGSSGCAVPAGGGMMFPPIADTMYLDLALIYVFGSGTDRVSVVYGTH